MRLYYQEYLAGRITNINEFERKYSNITDMLTRWGLEVGGDAELSEIRRSDPEFGRVYAELDRWFKGEEHSELIAHDTFLLRHIRHLRGPVDATPGRTRYWLLTYDQRLTRFGVYYSTLRARS